MMEVTKVLTSVFVLCLSGPTFGYPFTRSGGNLFSATHPGGEASVAGGPRGGHQQQQLPAHLEDYLANYVQGAAAAAPARQFPQYQPSQAQAYQQGYIAQAPQPKLTAETLAALLPYLSSSSGASLNGVSASGPSDYVWEMPDYPSAAVAPPAYTDDDGTWYDDMAGQAQVFNNEPPTMMRAQDEEEQAVLQLLLDHLNGRYSLDDLEAMEREAEMEENTESQLQSLMNKKVRRHEIMNDFGQGDDQHLTIRRLREHVGGNSEADDVDVEEHKEQESARDNTRTDSHTTSEQSGSQDHKSSADSSTGLQKRSWGQTIGHLSFWGPNRYQSHRVHKGDIGHINFFSPL